MDFTDQRSQYNFFPESSAYIDIKFSNKLHSVEGVKKDKNFIGGCRFLMSNYLLYKYLIEGTSIFPSVFKTIHLSALDIFLYFRHVSHTVIGPAYFSTLLIPIVHCLKSLFNLRCIIKKLCCVLSRNSIQGESHTIVENVLCYR